jgi:hypothetical protein
MKQIIALIALAIAGLTFNANAQEVSTPDHKVKFGLKAGLNVSNVYDVEGSQFDADAKMGLVLGTFVSIPLGKHLGLQPEILFSQKGFRGTGEAAGTPYYFYRTTSYFDLPLLLVLRAGPAVSFVAGPHLSYLVAQRDAVRTGDYSTVHDQTFSNQNVRRNTVGLTAGMEFYNKPVVLSTRVGCDFTNNNGDGTSSAPSYKNLWLQVTAGFKI